MITNWLESKEAFQKLKEADAIVHLSGEIFARTWQEYSDANIKTTEIVAQALREGKAQKAVFISYPGAAADSDNLFLKAKGTAEKLLTETGKDVVIFRVQSIINTPENRGPFEDFLTYKGKEPVRIIGNGTQPIRLVFRPDAVQAVCKALEMNHKGIYDLYSEEMSLADLVAMLNQNTNFKLAKTPIWLAQIFSRISKELSPTVVNLYARKPAVMNNALVKRDLNLTFTPLNSIWK